MLSGRRPANDDPIFLSFSSDDEYWVRQFALFLHPRISGEVLVYTDPGRGLPFGRLDQWIEQRVSRAPAVFVFLSGRYLRSRACKAEFNVAFSRFKKNEVVFVPIILDEIGRKGWNRLRLSREYKDQLKDFVCEDFATAYGPANLFLEGRGGIAIEKPSALQRVRALAELVASTISFRGPPQRRPAAAGSSNGAARPAGNLVLLGDPTHQTPDHRIGANFEILSQQLRDAKVPFKPWPHGWGEAVEGLPKKDMVSPPATFLRIVRPLDIVIEAGAKKTTLELINLCGRVDGKVKGDVIVWCPDGDGGTPVGGKGPRGGGGSSGDSLRRESAETLAKWLAKTTGRTRDEDLPLLLIIDEPTYGKLDNAPYRDVVKMVSELANIPLSEEPLNSQEFKTFVERDRHRRLIVAVLDNNVNMSDPDPLESFEMLVERWQRTIAAINKAKGMDVEVTWVAVMARLADSNPNAVWNKRSRDPIHVLRVVCKGDEVSEPSFAPDESSVIRVADSIKQLLARP